MTLSTLLMPSPNPLPRAAYEARDVFAAGLFPVCPATHDLGIRRLFDLSTLLLLLDCRPGDRVLDLGAGPGFASEMLARLGYDVVAVDSDFQALRNNRGRIAFDSTRIEGTVETVQGLAEYLPFAGASFDGVLGMNVLHHLSNLTIGVSELARVLKSGCRAVFAEPGLDHLDADETRRAIREHGENDQAFDVMAFLKMAKEHGFKHAMLSATLQSPLRLLPFEEIDLYLSGQHPRPHLTPRGVMEVLQRRQPYVMLERDGVRPTSSRHPGVLKCELAVVDVISVVKRGGQFTVSVRALNSGDTIWDASPRRRGGFVTLGCKLLTAKGRLLTDTIGRTFLPCDVHPGETINVHAMIAVPLDIEPGQYRLQFDLVDEQICWFGDVSPESPVTSSITVA